MNLHTLQRAAIAACVLLAASSCGADQGEGHAPSAVDPTLHSVDIIDASGFGQPMVAASMLVPAGWQASGGVGWNRSTDCVSNQLQIAWRAQAPDGMHAIELLPGFSWQVQGTQIQMNPCPAMPFASTRDFLLAVVQRHRPGARVLQYRERPQLAKATPAPGNGAQVYADAGQLLIAYASGNVEVNEAFSATVNFSNMGGNVVAGTATVFAQRAPAGALDFALGDRIATSLQPDPQWLAIMRDAGNRAVTQYSDAQRGQIERWHNARMNEINARGAADRAAIRANTASEIAAINAQTNANTAASNERMHERNLEAIGEYNRYRAADGGQVRSSIHGGTRVLQLQDGSAINTDDPYYNPAGSTELEREE